MVTFEFFGSVIKYNFYVYALMAGVTLAITCGLIANACYEHGYKDGKAGRKKAKKF